MKTVYLDTCIAIHLVEKHPLYASRVETLLDSTHTIFCISPLVRLECLIKPYKSRDAALLHLFEAFFDTQTLLAITSKTFDDAARLRADFASLKTLDALHLTTAQNHGCDEFWTNDDRLDKIAPALVKTIL